MAKQTLFLDDLDPTGKAPADRTVRFSIDGDRYEIDLSAANERALRAVFAPWILHARPAGRRTRQSKPHRRESAAIRAWAKERGLEVPTHGRIPDYVVRQYEDEAD